MTFWGHGWFEIHLGRMVYLFDESQLPEVMDILYLLAREADIWESRWFEISLDGTAYAFSESQLPAVKSTLYLLALDIDYE